jgi:hypothetical protein
MEGMKKREEKSRERLIAEIERRAKKKNEKQKNA